MSPRAKQFARFLAKLLAAPVLLAALFHAFLLAGLVHERGWRGAARFVGGEPGATQDVNDAADWLIASHSAGELEAFADRVARDYGPTASRLPKAFLGDPMFPLSEVPTKFMRLGWHRTWERNPPPDPKYGPECVLRFNDRGEVTAVEIQWGHRRHVAIVYARPPAREPRGFAVRKVTPRVFILANES